MKRLVYLLFLLVPLIGYSQQLLLPSHRSVTNIAVHILTNNTVAGPGITLVKTNNRVLIIFDQTNLVTVSTNFSFNTNQFSLIGTNISIKSGALLTNTVIRSLGTNFPMVIVTDTNAFIGANWMPSLMVNTSGVLYAYTTLQERTNRATPVGYVLKTVNASGELRLMPDDVSGDSQWSMYPAVSDANLSGYSLTNVGAVYGAGPSVEVRANPLFYDINGSLLFTFGYSNFPSFHVIDADYNTLLYSHLGYGSYITGPLRTDGSLVTNLNASFISTGAVAQARMATNIASDGQVLVARGDSTRWETVSGNVEGIITNLYVEPPLEYSGNTLKLTNETLQSLTTNTIMELNVGGPSVIGQIKLWDDVNQVVPISAFSGAVVVNGNLDVSGNNIYASRVYADLDANMLAFGTVPQARLGTNTASEGQILVARGNSTRWEAVGGGLTNITDIADGVLIASNKNLIGSGNLKWYDSVNSTRIELTENGNIEMYDTNNNNLLMIRAIAGDITCQEVTANTFYGNTFYGNFVGDVTGNLSGDGSGLYNLNASTLNTGTIPSERLPEPLQPLSTNNAAALTNLNASELASGTVPANRLRGLTNVTFSSLRITNEAIANNDFIIMTNGSITTSGGMTNNVLVSSNAILGFVSIGQVVGFPNYYTLTLNGRTIASAGGWVFNHGPVYGATNIDLGPFRAGTFQTTVIATNGFVLPQLSAVPTNQIPTSSSGNTNWVLVNLSPSINGGGPQYVARGSDNTIYLLKPSYTQTILE